MWSSQETCPSLVVVVLLFILSAFCANSVMCLTDAVHKSNVISISSNGTVPKDQLNATVPSKMGGGGGGGGGWWSYGWGWGSGGGGGGGSGGGGGGGGGGGAGRWGSAGGGGGGGGGGGSGSGSGDDGRKGHRHRHGGRGHHRPSYSPRLYRVGEYARCSGRNRCRGARLLCPMHCSVPCFYDCESNCMAHCRLDLTNNRP